MELGIIVSSQTDMYIRRLLIKVRRAEVDGLAPAALQRPRISPGGSLQQMDWPAVRAGVEPLWSRDASRRIRTREQSHSIVY